MTNDQFMNESIDLKRLFLCLKGRLFQMLLIAALGAILSGAAYYVVRLVRTPVIYQAQSQFYLKFVYDPEGKAEQYYNGYTWNDLVHSDAVMDRAADALIASADAMLLFPAGSTPHALKEFLRDNHVKAEILSDRRLLTLTYSGDSSEIIRMIGECMDIAVIGFSNAQEEIISIDQILKTEPKLQVWDDLTERAFFFGAVLFFIIALVIFGFSYILDDSLYTPQDAERRYPFPALGIVLKGEDRDGELFFAETKDNLDFILKDKPAPYFLETTAPYPEASGLRSGNGVILEVPFGKRNGKEIDRCVSFLRNQNIDILGLLIIEADRKFLEQYYCLGRKPAKKEKP